MFSVWFHIRKVFSDLMTGKRRTIFSLVSLSAALALCVFVLLYARYESSWDHHFKDYKRIYRFSSVVLVGKSQGLVSLTPLPLNHLLAQQEEVEASTRIFTPGNGLIRINNQSSFENRFFLADSNISDVLSLKWVYGGGGNALPDTNSVAISLSGAHRYFGKSNPIGQEVVFNDVRFVVTAVFDNLPVNTHLHPEFIGSLDAISLLIKDKKALEDELASWMRISCYTYVKFKPGVDVDAFTGKINLIKDEVSADELAAVKQFFNSPGDNVAIDFVAEPISDIHFLSKAEFPIEKGIKFAYIAIFVSLAFLILIFAGINFVHTTEATSASRTAELQSLLLMGVSRFQLFRRLKIEIIVHSIVAAFLALVIVELLISIVNGLLGIQLGLWEADYHSTGVLLFVGVISVAAGILPSYRFVYGYPLADGLRLRHIQSHFGFKGFILFAQIVLFSFLMFVIIGMWSTLVALRSSNPGFDARKVMVIERSDLLGTKWPDFKAGVEVVPGVDGVATARSIPGVLHSTSSYKVSNLHPDPMVLLTVNEVSPEFFEVMGCELKNGAFIGNTQSDSLAVMLNEMAVNKYGIIKPVGELIEIDNYRYTRSVDMVVKGVIGNYYFDDYTNPINPMIIMLAPGHEAQNFVLMRINGDFGRKAIRQIEAEWNKCLPGMPFAARPLQQYVDKQFNDDFRMLRIGLVLLIVSFYVFITGLIAFAGSQYESNVYKLSVRMLCGAPIYSLVAMLSIRLLWIIVVGLGLSLLVSISVISAFQGVFAVPVAFPWIPVLTGVFIVIAVSVALFALSCFSLLKRKHALLHLLR